MGVRILLQYILQELEGGGPSGLSCGGIFCYPYGLEIEKQLENQNFSWRYGMRSK